MAFQAKGHRVLLPSGLDPFGQFFTLLHGHGVVHHLRIGRTLDQNVLLQTLGGLAREGPREGKQGVSQLSGCDVGGAVGAVVQGEQGGKAAVALARHVLHVGNHLAALKLHTPSLGQALQIGRGATRLHALL